MTKLKNNLYILLPTILCVVILYPLFFEGKLFQGITPLQVGYSHNDYFFKDMNFSWIYSLNLLGEPLLANPTNGLLSLKAISYLILSTPWAYKVNFIFAFTIFYYFSYKLLISRTTKKIATLLPLAFLATPLLLSTTQRLSLWSTIWIPAFLYIFTKAINTNSKLIYLLAGLVLSRTFSNGDPFLFILLPTLCYLLLEKRPTKEFTLTIMAFLVGTLPFLVFYSEIQPLMARHYGQPEEIALRFSNTPRRVLELFTNSGLSPSPGITWFRSVSLGLVISFLFFFTLLKSKKKIALAILSLMTMALILSFGENFVVSKEILLSTPLLNQLRYPEKFTIYIFAIVLSFTFFKSKQLKSIKFISVLIFISIMEGLIFRPNFSFIDENLITNRKVLKKYQNNQTRFKICPNGLRNYSPNKVPNLRAFGVATLNTTSNITSSALKMVNCKNVIINENAIRLGVSHLLFMNLTQKEKEILNNSNWSLEETEGQFYIYKHKIASPLKAIVTNNIKIRPFLKFKGKEYKKNTSIDWKEHIIDSKFSLDNGRLKDNVSIKIQEGCYEEALIDIKPSYNSQKFEARVNSSCGSFLLIPWYFSPGWKAYSGNRALQVYRINDISMGIQLDKGQQKIEFLYLPKKWPIFFTYLVLIIIALTPIILKLHQKKIN